MSRHLYDLEKMMDAYCETALADNEIYEAIIAHRKKFYHIGIVDYSKDERQDITIWPNEELENAYEKDYRLMTQSFIYDESPLTFEELKQRIKSLETLFRDNC